MMGRADSLRRGLLHAAFGGIAFAAVIGMTFSRHGSMTDFVISWGISSLYSLNIGIPATLAFHWLRPRISGKADLRQWLLYAGTLLAVSAFGVAVTGLILLAIGLVPAGELWATYVGAFKIALLISLPMTVGAFSLSGLHRQIALQKSELERAHGLATEARLASLESRIRPHFLFNALNSAIALIPEDPPRAEKVLERLAALLRFSLDAHQSRLVALGEEMRIVADYLEIERVRFGERLRYELDVPAELASIEIPAFAVQTLVENSVKYAVGARTAGAAIAVRARRSGGQLAIEVTDDGPGFAGDPWVAGHGLDGLRARLDALYGAGARLIAPAPAEQGAAVTVEIPIAEEAAA